MAVNWPTREPETIERWWEPRRPDESVTAEFLGRVLDELGVADLAHRARLGHFDDYSAPAGVADGFELMRLVRELQRWGRGTNRVARLRARVVIEAIKHGEFDGTHAEAERWAASLDGQEALSDPIAMARARAIFQKLQDPQILEQTLRQADALIDDEGQAA